MTQKDLKIRRENVQIVNKTHDSKGMFSVKYGVFFVHLFFRQKFYRTIESNGCIRNTTAACGNVATGLLLRPRWPVHFLSCLGPFDAYHH